MLSIQGICVELLTKQFHERLTCQSWNRGEMAWDVWVSEERVCLARLQAVQRRWTAQGFEERSNK